MTKNLEAKKPQVFCGTKFAVRITFLDVFWTEHWLLTPAAVREGRLENISSSTYYVVGSAKYEHQDT